MVSCGIVAISSPGNLRSDSARILPQPRLIIAHGNFFLTDRIQLHAAVANYMSISVHRQEDGPVSSWKGRSLHAGSLYCMILSAVGGVSLKIKENRSRSGTPSASASQNGRTLLNLREMVLRGDFVPGERISELPLVARLGVSRTPIRLGLDRLAHEGLLEPASGGGFVVRAFTLADVWDALEVRGVLEGTAARLAAERLTDNRDLQRLRRYRDEMESISRPNVDSFARYLDLNEAFHSAIVDLARSHMLRRTIDLVMALPFASPSALVFARSKAAQGADMFAISQEHHRVIVESIEERQGSRAESVAREHANLSRRNLEIALNDRDILQTVPGACLIRLSDHPEF